MDLPEFVRPLIELEQRVPESYYINMLVTYPGFVGWALAASYWLMSKNAPSPPAAA